MEHLLLKAATTVTDEGVFEAVISTATIDRELDIVEPQAMVDALKKYTALGKKVALRWNHGTEPDDIIGLIEPESARVVDGEVVVSGRVDMETNRGSQAWRLIKTGVIGFSFGYLVPEGGSTKRVGGGKHITALDVYEITAFHAVMNNDTRVLSFKSPEELRVESQRLAREVEETKLEDVPPKRQTPPGPLTKALHGLDTNDLTAQQTAEALDTLAFGDVHLHVRVITADELAGVTSGQVKAVWTTAYINNLPDSAFLHIESGGSKDSEGKTTPRSLRHFPYKDAEGNIDLPHLRNALSRIPQSNLPQDVKDRLASRAQQILDRNKSVDVTDKEPSARSVDPLRQRSEELALEISSGGMSLRKPPTQVKAKPPEPVDVDALRRESRVLMFEVLSYSTE